MYPKVPIKTIKDEEYVYVNSIQYKRILSRREKRKKLNIVPRRYPPNEKVI